jgi:hypothetical protein
MLVAAPSDSGDGFVSPQNAGPARGLTYGLARESEERLGAFRLIHDAYVRAGLGQPTASGMRVTPYQILPTSQIFVGKLEDQVVSTVSLIGDGELGLPMETIFGAEVQALRQQGERLAEVSCLADRRQDGRRFLSTFRQLTRLMAQFARYEGIQSLLITVHPRHVRFYEDLLGFVPISDRVASCPYVRGNPAVALRLEFARIDRERPACYDEYFAEWLDRELLRPYTISREELDFLSGLTTAVEIFQVASFVKPQPASACQLAGPLAAASVPALASSD